MSEDNDNHFKRFHQSYVTMKKKDGDVLNVYLFQAGPILLFLPGGDIKAQPQVLFSVAVESMTKWHRD